MCAPKPKRRSNWRGKMNKATGDLNQAAHCGAGPPFGNPSNRRTPEMKHFTSTSDGDFSCTLVSRRGRSKMLSLHGIHEHVHLDVPPCMAAEAGRVFRRSCGDAVLEFFWRRSSSSILPLMALLSAAPEFTCS